MAIIKLSAIERRRLSVFITCLVLAVVAWVFATFSRQYEFVVKEVMVFKNAPQKRAFHPLQSDTVEVKVKGSGWQMLFSKMYNSTRFVSVDLSSLDTKNFIVLNAQVKRINDSKEFDHSIVAFNPDTLYFDFTNRLIKKVPVELISKLKFQKQYGISNRTIIKPAYITVSGPGNIINQITSWKTDTLKLDKANETINARINLQPVKEGNINIYPKTVQVKVPVEEFTEKMLEIPVKVINNSNYNNVKIVPQKVKVTFTTALNRYADTNEDLFEATVDMALWRNHGYKVLPVKINRVPAYSKIVSVEPANVDFIIKK